MTDPRGDYDQPGREPGHGAQPPGAAGRGGPVPGAQPPGGPAPGYPAGPGWGNPWTGPSSYPSGASGFWGPGWAAPPPRRRGLAKPLAAAAALLVAGAAIGVGVGHATWSTQPEKAAASTTPVTPRQQDPYAGVPPFGRGGSSGSGNGGSSGGFPGSGSGSSGGSSSNSNGGPSDVASIAAKVDPALVDINVTFGYQNAQGAGTGIVLTANGEVLTNNHVIDGATSISVTDIGNGHTYSASVAGYDSSHDIAVLHLKDASGLQTAKIGNSSKIAIGQSVVAIGNAGGAGGTPTSAGGSVTGLNQSITAHDALDGASEQLAGLIEVNANIQSGDSGGSLVDSAGRVIGVDTAASDQFSFQSSGGGQGYAVPINQATSVAKKIEAGNGSSTIHVGPTAFLGIMTTSVDNDEPGFGGTGTAIAGAQVAGVLPGGAAERAGLTQGDVITSLDGHPISSPSQLTDALLTYRPGDKVTLGWTDTAGAGQSATVQLGSGPAA